MRNSEEATMNKEWIGGIVMALAATLLMAVAARAQTPDPEAARAVRILAEGLREHAALPGLALSVDVGGRIAFSEAFGVADLESGAPATPATRFRIGSVGKSLTAAGALLLAERGRLDLDARVDRYVPAGTAGAATARQLAGHLGGVRHYRRNDFLVTAHYDDVVDALALFVADTLVAPPGTRYAYSTHGYTLLSAVIQAAAGEPFLAWMEREVFAPIGMRATRPDDVTVVVPRRAAFYRIEEGEVAPARFTDNSYKWAGGGFLSTAEDLARFGSALLDGTLLGAGGAEKLFASQRTSAGEETGYGMGFRPGRDWEDRRVVHHGGSAEGGRAFLLLYPDEKVVVALAANRENAPLFEQEAQTIAHFFLEHDGAGGGALDDSLSGSWRFDGAHGDDAVAGELRIHAKGSIRGMLEWSEEQAPIRILLVDRHGERLRLVGVGPHGLMNAWLAPEEDGWSGRWDYLGKGGDVRLERMGS
jgi:CubicO group peptidase (beta-lactamase class C family)